MAYSEVLKKEIHVNFIHVGLVVNEDWLCDKWFFSFPANNVTVEFYTGIGLHRKQAPIDDRSAFKRLTNIRRRFDQMTDIEKLNYIKALEKCSVIKSKPNIDDLLNSMVKDSYALNIGFDEWCLEYGYSNGSRKALETYLACQKQTEKLMNLGLNYSLNKLAELYQDF